MLYSDTRGNKRCESKMMMRENKTKRSREKVGWKI